MVVDNQVTLFVREIEIHRKTPLTLKRRWKMEPELRQNSWKNPIKVSMTSLFYEQGQLHHLYLIRQDQHIRQAVTRILTSNFVLIQLKKMDQHLCKSEVDIFI
jgi:hypothetical protein